MSVLSSIENTTKEFFSGGGTASPPAGLTISNIDVNAVLEVVNAIVSAAPAIVDGIQSATPFVEAICELIANGGKPTDEQWAALRARLDANSGVLANAEDVAQAEIDAASVPVPADKSLPEAAEVLATTSPEEGESEK